MKFQYRVYVNKARPIDIFMDDYDRRAALNAAWHNPRVLATVEAERARGIAAFVNIEFIRNLG